MKILKEGPGAGYSVSAAVAFRTVNDIKILDIKPEDDYATIEFSCVAHGLADKLKADSYDYSVSLDDAVDCEMTRGKITIPGTGLRKDVLIDLIRDEILNCLIETECTLGGGYSHVKYEGALAEIDSEDISLYDGYDYESELYAADIYITDVKVINYIDSAVQGENFIHNYEVLDDSYDVVGDTFSSFDDAKKFAELNNLNKIHDFIFETDIDGNAVYIDDDVINIQTESIDESLSFDDNINMIDILWPKEHILEFATELEYKIKETTGDETVNIDDVYIDDNSILHITICTNNNCFEETVDLNSEFKDVYDLMSNGVEVLNKKFADKIISDNELWNEVHKDEFDLTENVIESAATFYNTYNMTVEEAVKKAVDICNDVHSEGIQDISYESILEEVKTKLDEGRNKPYGEMAYNLNEIISAMNNEEAYYGEWLYTWVDGSSLDDAFEYFGDEDSYNDLLELFKEIYKEYHDDGLYTSSQRIINMAHSWDKKLGLDEIEVLTPNKI